MRKTIFAVCILIIGAVIFVYSQFNTLIVDAVETFGPKFTGTPVGLDSARISVLSGEGAIKGLYVGNPEGFSKANALEVGEVHVAINAATVLTDTVEISRIEIRSPHVLYEAGAKGTNLQAIANHLRRFEQKEQGGASQDNAPAEAGKKVVINQLVITDAQAAMAVSGLGGATVTLPEIRMSNIGRDSGGMSFAEVSDMILNALLRATSKAASSQAVQDAAKNLGKTVEDAAGELQQGLDSLLK
jgi:hypothetical protein